MGLLPGESARQHTSTRKPNPPAPALRHHHSHVNMWKYVFLQRLRTSTRAAVAARAARSRTQSGALGVENRDREMKLGTLPHFAVYPDAATVHLHEVLGNGQAQSGSASLPRTRGMHTVEALANARLV